METRKLGPMTVSAMGLGCMAMSGVYGPADDTESIATIHEALDNGITLLDTGDFYGMGHNEMLIRDALRGRKRESVLLSVKFGAMREPGQQFIGFDGRPAAVKNFLSYSLRRLGTEYIDIYRPSRLDPTVPIEETVGAIADLVRAGYVRHVGLSEVGPGTIRRANAVHPIVDLQFEYSLFSRSIETAVLPTCRSLGIGVTAYGVLSRGLLGGSWSVNRAAGKHDMRVHLPRFSGSNAEQNIALVDRLRTLAQSKGITVAQLAIAWVASRGEDIIPLVGARNRRQLQDVWGVRDIRLTPEDLAGMEAMIPPAAVAGDRYGSQQMANLDSERR